MAAVVSALNLNAISPWLEMGAYEFLWTKGDQTFKRIADLFRDESSTPSNFVLPGIAEEYARQATEILRNASVEHFGIRVSGAGEYPQSLRDAKHPIQLLYFSGWWDLIETPCVAVVGTRNPSDEGRLRAARIAKSLVNDNFTVVSGLAAGIDTVAHETAIKNGGRTIAVIGTPLSEVYPRQNAALQKLISKSHLLISQVPIIRYSKQDWRTNRGFFPQRNVTMSALTRATIIVEASDTSGTLMQARAAIHQKRKLFILDSCFRNSALTWPARFEAEGAVRVRAYEDIKKHLAESHSNRRTKPF